MGYILPIQSTQSQQYANRILMTPNHFSWIDRVQRVKLSTEFYEDFRDTLSQAEQEMEQENQKSTKAQIVVAGKSESEIPTLPHPMIAQVIGKGISIDTYG
jgi:hypothetical protein